MSKGRYLVSTLSLFQRATKETHNLAIKFIAKKPEHVRNCEGWANCSMVGSPELRFSIRADIGSPLRRAADRQSVELIRRNGSLFITAQINQLGECDSKPSANGNQRTCSAQVAA